MSAPTPDHADGRIVFLTHGDTDVLAVASIASSLDPQLPPVRVHNVGYLRDEADAPTLDGRVWHHQGVYAYRREALARWVALPPHPLELIERLEQLRPLAAGMAIGVALVAEPPRGGIDTEADLERANADWTELTSDGL